MSATETRQPLRIIGTELVRHDAIEKARGRTRYAADMQMPRMVHAMLRRSDFAHARLAEIDITHAVGLDGVIGVWLARDIPRNTALSSVDGQTDSSGPSRVLSTVLAEEVVRYHGEPIALVVAETEDACLAARDAIEIDYEPLPVVTDPARALDPDSPRVHEDGNLLCRWSFEEGDVDTALASAAAVVSGVYETQFVDHAYLEPEAGTAWVDTDGVIVVRAATQVVERSRDLARILGVDDNRVRVIAPYIGGGFGGKEDMTVEPYLALAAHWTQRPVRMVWSRQESLLARYKRHPIRMTYTSAADKNGRLVAHDVELLLDGGAYAQLSVPVLQWAMTCSTGPYRCENVRVHSTVVFTNHTPCSAMRGFGAMQVVLAYEGQLDALAQEIGLDRLEIRRRNFVEQGDRLPVGQPLETHVALPELVSAVEERMGPKLPDPSSPRSLVGRGFACNLQPYGFSIWANDWSSAWVGFELDGGLVLRSGVPDVGAGQASSLVQIASEVLGVAPDRITIHIGDSALTPLAGRTSSTRQLYMSGNAVLKAARELRADLAEVAAALLEVDQDSVEFTSEGVRDTAELTRLVTFPDLLAACIAQGTQTQRLATFHAPRGLPWRADPSWRGRIAPDCTYGCHGVDLELDTETGQVRILRYVAAHDVGRAINPQSVRGQIEGAVAMGLGQALSERIVYDEGQNLVGTFAQYLTPTAVEVPDVEAVVLESGEGLGPFESRGVGEPPIGPPAAAIASALWDATGTAFRVTPFTPERISNVTGGST